MLNSRTERRFWGIFRGFSCVFAPFSHFAVLPRKQRFLRLQALKSLGRDTVPVQVRPRAPRKNTPLRCVFSWSFCPNPCNRSVQKTPCVFFGVYAKPRPRAPQNPEFSLRNRGFVFFRRGVLLKRPSFLASFYIYLYGRARNYVFLN